MTGPSLKRILSAAATVLALACSPPSEDDGVSSSSSPGASKPRQSSGCDQEAGMFEPASEDRVLFEEDLDGDGGEEMIVLVKDPKGDTGCKAVLGVASSSIGQLAVAIDDELSFDLGLPAIAGVAEIDGSGPNEIVVNIAQGASTGFVGVFSVQEGRLVRRLIKGDSPYSRLFPFGGSVGHLEGSDCLEPGTVVISSATARQKGYMVIRRFFESAGEFFVLQDQEIEQVASPRLKSFPEFSSVPFANCRRQQ